MSQGVCGACWECVSMYVGVQDNDLRFQFLNHLRTYLQDKLQHFVTQQTGRCLRMIKKNSSPHLCQVKGTV